MDEQDATERRTASRGVIEENATGSDGTGKEPVNPASLQGHHQEAG